MMLRADDYFSCLLLFSSSNRKLDHLLRWKSLLGIWREESVWDSCPEEWESLCIREVVLVWDVMIKYPSLRGFWTTDFIAQFWRLGSPKSGCQHDGVLVKDLYGLCIVSFSLDPPMVAGARELFLKSTNPIHKSSILSLSASSKSPTYAYHHIGY